MTPAVENALQTLENSISDLEKKLDHKTARAGQGQAELFGISQEEKTLNKTIADKLDSTIQRLETLLQEE